MNGIASHAVIHGRETCRFSFAETASAEVFEFLLLMPFFAGIFALHLAWEICNLSVFGCEIA